MWCCNDVHAVMTYGTSAYYKAAPSPEQRATGVVPLDSLPAAWWNCMWCDTNSAINEARDAIGSFIDEVNTLLTNAGIQPNCNCVDTIYRAINKIRQTVGDAATAGAVKSSSCPSEVAIDATGIMSVNCLGNAASLTTTARTVVGAVNELKSTYDCCFTDVGTALGGKASTSHASSATTYGVGTASDYGHLKISDEYATLVGCACDGIAASQKAVNDLYQLIPTETVNYSNNAACAETCNGTAGISSCVSRGDHTHPYPKHMCAPYFTLGQFASCPFACFQRGYYTYGNPGDYCTQNTTGQGSGTENMYVTNQCFGCIYSDHGGTKLYCSCDSPAPAFSAGRGNLWETPLITCTRICINKVSSASACLRICNLLSRAWLHVCSTASSYGVGCCHWDTGTREDWLAPDACITVGGSGYGNSMTLTGGCVTAIICAVRVLSDTDQDYVNCANVRGYDTCCTGLFPSRCR